ncbi:MAG: hypothetical protein HY245_14385 [Rhizobiales bacterium]|nr:hypothetical protein [Hyphomicrobiales bacterium]MBI3674580.1 hypothetical protein [Hyphomicrobiales bacterium]
MTSYDKTTIKHIHEGRFAAEVEITLHYDDEVDWSPTIGPADVEKLDRVIRALKQGDVKTAAKEAKVFELLPLAGE